MRKCCAYAGTDDCPPCVPWWAFSTSESESRSKVDLQMRWNLIGTTKIAKCGYALEGQYPPKS